MKKPIPKGKKGKGMDLQAVQVLDHVEYIPKEDFPDVEGASKSSNGVDIKEDF